MPQSRAHIALVVRDYDEAIAWFTQVLGFTLVADQYQPEQDKRWVLVAPPGAGESAATLLLARASSPEQEKFIGNQAGGRVFLFLKTDDFYRDYEAYRARGVRFVREPPPTPTARSPSSRTSTATSGTSCSPQVARDKVRQKPSRTETIGEARMEG